MEINRDLVERNIISRKDKEYCLEKIGTKLGAPLESIGRVYDVSVRKVHPDKRNYSKVNLVATGMYLWVNRSGSLREMTETNIENFPRFARYLVLHDEKDGRTILLYGASIKNQIRGDSHGKEYVDREVLVVEADLSIPMDDVFEAMRFINKDIIGNMYIDEYYELLNVPNENIIISKSISKN